MTRTFTNAISPWVTGSTAAIFAVAAIAVGVQASTTAGLGVALIGLGFVAMMRFARTPQRIICDPSGVIVTSGRDGHATKRSFAWTDVKTTKYDERPISPWDGHVTVGVFTLEGSSGPLLEITTAWRDFDAILRTCNDATTHVLYVWVPDGEAPSRDTIERGGAYARTSRPAAHYSKLAA